MKVLVACEYSGVVRDAFLKQGVDAMSCDLLPSESNNGNHYIGDAREILNLGWDLMIAHPPCQYLSYAGNRHWFEKDRARKRLEALDFFLTLWEAPIERICIENPLGVAQSVIAKYSQIIEPYYFGDNARKRTCLWLKNLPPLVWQKQNTLFESATALPPPKPIRYEPSGRACHFVEVTCGRDRAKKRAKTFRGIAEAMAKQWGTLSI